MALALSALVLYAHCVTILRMLGLGLSVLSAFKSGKVSLSAATNELIEEVREEIRGKLSRELISKASSVPTVN